VIEEEGQLSQCRLCGLFGTTADSDGHRESLVACQKFAEKRRQHFQAQRQTRAREEVTFQVGGQEISRVDQFRYLGRVLDEDDRATVGSPYYSAYMRDLSRWLF